MFVLITGKPRSGKSYYAVHHMIKNKDNYHNVLANVNGLKMHDNIKPLNFDDLLVIIDKCKSIYEQQLSLLGKDGNLNVIDEPIKEYLLSIDFISYNSKYEDYLKSLKERKNNPFIKRYLLNLFKPIYSVPKYLPTLIIMDEAQNQFPLMIDGKKALPDPLISWWISYHGHLYMDVFLLSQNYHKINPAYIYDIEYFLDAIPSSRSLLGNFSKTFTYKHHIKTPFNNTNLAGKKVIRKSKDVFNAYESGDKVRTKSVVLPYIFMSLGALVLLIIVFSYVSSNLGKDSNVHNNSIDNVQHISKVSTVINSNISDISYDNLEYLTLLCMSNICTNKHQNITLHIDDLKDFLQNTQSKYLRSKKISQNLAKVYLLVSPRFKKLFQGAINEKNNKGFTLIN